MKLRGHEAVTNVLSYFVFEAARLEGIELTGSSVSRSQASGEHYMHLELNTVDLNPNNGYAVLNTERSVQLPVYENIGTV